MLAVVLSAVRLTAQRSMVLGSVDTTLRVQQLFIESIQLRAWHPKSSSVFRDCLVVFFHHIMLWLFRAWYFESTEVIVDVREKLYAFYHKYLQLSILVGTQLSPTAQGSELRQMSDYFSGSLLDLNERGTCGLKYRKATKDPKGRDPRL